MPGARGRDLVRGRGRGRGKGSQGRGRWGRARAARAGQSPRDLEFPPMPPCYFLTYRPDGRTGTGSQGGVPGRAQFALRPKRGPLHVSNS